MNGATLDVSGTGNRLALTLAIPAELAPAEVDTGTPWAVVVSAYLDAAPDSPHTRRAYRRHLLTAFAALGVATIAELTGARLAAYRARVVSSGLAPKSQAQQLTALRSCLAWSRAIGAHTLSSDVVGIALRTPRATVQRPFRTLSDSEVWDLFDGARTARDRALLAVSLGGGLRAAEVVGLDVADLIDDPGGLLLYVRMGKGRKDRQVPVRDDVRRELFAYLDARACTLGTSGPLFVAHDRARGARPPGRLTTRSFGHFVRTCAARAGLGAKATSPHTLRHTFAVRYLRAGGNVVALAKLLGHASITTTQKYLDHLGLDELREKLPPLLTDPPA